MRPETIGRYHVIETLGRGGMGVVYKARDPLIDRVVAIKTLGFGLSPIEAQAFRKRFAREAKSAGRLNHPNIVTIHDMGESDEGAYIAMEFLEGRSLRDLFDSGAVLPPPQIAQIAMQVADGLAYAHRNGVVHCDIKPGNIVLLENGTAKITDFGIAMLPTGSRTFAGNVLGSPRYISPEQIVGHPVDERADLFSLGAVLYEMLTGVPPFAAETIDEILHQILNDRPEAPSVRNRSIPPAFDAIVERAMAKDPDERYQDAQAMVDALRSLGCEPKPLPAPLPPLPPLENAMLREPGAKNHGTPISAAGAPSAVELVAAVEKARDNPGRRGRGRLILAGIPAVLLTLALWTWFTSHPDVEEIASPVRAASTIVPKAGKGTIPVGTAQASMPQPPSLAKETRALDATSSASEWAVATGDPVLPAVAEAREEPKASAVASSPAISTPSAIEPDATRSAVTPPAPASATAAPSAPRPPVVSMGRLELAVSPWGEVYIDGRRRGVAPPLTELKLPPGKYHVEIRNTAFAPHTETVELAGNATLRIRYKFQ